MDFKSQIIKEEENKLCFDLNDRNSNFWTKQQAIPAPVHKYKNVRRKLHSLSVQ
jgi:hypothetical protein